MSLLVGAVKVYAYALEKTPPIMTTVRLKSKEGSCMLQDPNNELGNNSLWDRQYGCIFFFFTQSSIASPC